MFMILIMKTSKVYERKRARCYYVFTKGGQTIRLDCAFSKECGKTIIEQLVTFKDYNKYFVLILCSHTFVLN